MYKMSHELQMCVSQIIRFQRNGFLFAGDLACSAPSGASCSAFLVDLYHHTMSRDISICSMIETSTKSDIQHIPLGRRATTADSSVAGGGAREAECWFILFGFWLFLDDGKLFVHCV